MEFYRYDWCTYATLDIDGEFKVPKLALPSLVKHTYVLIKETPKGYWIGYYKHSKPICWVSKTSRKRYAYPTIPEALTGFIKRTERRASILKHTLDKCNAAIRLAEIELKKAIPPQSSPSSPLS
jgi:hypothetical protein